MRELGERHDAGAPRRRRAVVAHAGIDALVVVGDEARGSPTGPREHGGWAGELVAAAGRDEASTWLRKNVVPGDVVLVKASRGVALEHVADALLDPPTAEGGHA